MFDTNFPNNQALIRNANNHLEFISNGALGGYIDNVQKTHISNTLIFDKQDYQAHITFPSSFSNLHYHLYFNDKGLPKIQPTSNTTDLQNNAGYTLLYNASGTSTNRPTSRLTNDFQTIGFQYFDTTLNKPIWWNGTAWVDATGTNV